MYQQYKDTSKHRHRHHKGGGEQESNVVDYIRKSVVGRDAVIETPFGSRPLTYCDYTASGRLLSFVEDYISKTVGPLYANTHTEASATGLQTQKFREDARKVIRSAVNAADTDAVIFTGAGSTGGLEKLQLILGFRHPDDRWMTDAQREAHAAEDAEEARAVVFIGPAEHHSNECSWRESNVTVVVIEEDAHGHPDQTQLEQELIKYSSRPFRLASFNAGSNVTGIIPPVRRLASLCHRHGAFIVLDYAGSGPYVSIDMHPAGKPAQYFDGIVLSPHKLVGGPGSSGLLIASRNLLKREVPTMPGGGTVTYVSQVDVAYSSDIQVLEEAGTPGILQDIRCGLAFHIKNNLVGAKRIETLEHHWASRAIAELSRCPNVMLMGSDRKGFEKSSSRTSILSFNIMWNPTNECEEAARNAKNSRSINFDKGANVMLHPHFITAVLNDVYGIQSRSGCSCTGPYGHRLFGIDLNSKFEHEMFRVVAENDVHALKAGWARVNFNYFIDEDEFTFVIEAIKKVAADGWRLLPLYECDAATGMFTHRTFVPQPMAMTDMVFDARSGRVAFPEVDLDGGLRLRKMQLLEEAQELIRNAPAMAARSLGQFLVWDQSSSWKRGVLLRDLDEVAGEYRWFPLSHDAMEALRAEVTSVFAQDAAAEMEGRMTMTGSSSELSEAAEQLPGLVAVGRTQRRDSNSWVRANFQLRRYGKKPSESSETVSNSNSSTPPPPTKTSFPQIGSSNNRKVHPNPTPAA